MEREDIESNENRKQKNVNNQSNLEIINLKRKKVLDDINKFKDDQWVRRIKSKFEFNLKAGHSTISNQSR